MKQKKTIRPKMTEEACPRCLALAKKGELRMETVQRLPEGAFAPMSRDPEARGKCCLDCASADTLLATQMGVPGFGAARICVANDRQQSYRLPTVKLGLLMTGVMKPSEPGDLEAQHAWLDRHNWFGEMETE